MFTGIIEATAKILEKTESGLVIKRPAMFDDLKIGCSIAVSGVCLSVTAFDESSISFDVIETTLQKSKLGSLKAGDHVNLERAMKADGRFEGHIVLGHCEGVGKVLTHTHGTLTVSVPKDLRRFVVLHGSITIDGVALTVAGISGDSISVALIPHTLKHSTLGTLKTGDTVNLETDILAKYLLHAHDRE